MKPKSDKPKLKRTHPWRINVPLSPKDDKMKLPATMFRVIPR